MVQIAAPPRLTIKLAHLLLFPIICAAAAARADDRSSWPVSAASEWQVAAGPGLLISARYPGAATVRALPIPAIEASYGAFFVNGHEGAGLDLLNADGLRIGTAMFVRFGRQLSDDRARLSGLPDIDPAPQARLFAVQRIGRFQVRAMAERDLGGGSGTTLDLDASFSTRISNSVAVTVGPQATFGDGPFMRTYFSVASGGPRPAHVVSAGLYQAGAGASLITRVADRWTLVATTSVNWLQGAAARSPVVGNRAQVGGGIFLTYSFTAPAKRAAGAH